MLSPERQSARTDKIWSGRGCYFAVLIWQQWASEG